MANKWDDVFLVDPHDMDPPELDAIWMNIKGTVIMSRGTLAKIVQGEIPLKFDRLLDLDERQEILTIGFGNDEEEADDV